MATEHDHLLKSNFSRRRLLKTMFCASALLALNQQGRMLRAAEVGGGDLHWLAIGDFGSANKDQQTVADTMARHLKGLSIKPEALLLLGDNFYGKMKGGVKCDRWQSGFEKMYPADVFPGPCPVVLGNHDYHDNPGGDEIQVAYAKTPGTRWTLPQRWHRMDFPAVKPLVTYLFIDTNLRAVENGLGADGQKWPTMSVEMAAKQWAWFEEQLKGPRGTFTVVVGHHPVYSNGAHGDTPALIKQIGGLMQQHNVALYLCGHDHDMQHLELEGLKTSFVVSGGGGTALREPKQAPRGVYAGKAHGFTHLQASADRLVMRHIDADGKQIHAFEKYTDGKFKIQN